MVLDKVRGYLNMVDPTGFFAQATFLSSFVHVVARSSGLLTDRISIWGRVSLYDKKPIAVQQLSVVDISICWLVCRSRSMARRGIIPLLNIEIILAPQILVSLAGTILHPRQYGNDNVGLV